MRLIVLGDIHLHHGSDRAASEDFASLVDHALEQGPFRLVLSGDVYDLAVAGSAPLVERLEAIDAWHPGFHDALRRLCRAGGDVVLVPGNHDAEMVEPAGRAFFESRVPGARVSRWFHREPGVAHVEHGHQYDPDNAQPHPLASIGDALGVLLTRTMLARLGDLRLLRVAHATPIPIVLQCFIGYGLRTPGLIALYAWVGVKTVLRGDRGFEDARAAGAAHALALADERGLPPEELRALAALSARSVLENRFAAFRRMYLDRLFAFIAMMLGTLAAVFGLLKFSSAAEIGLAAAVVVAMTILSPNRYVGLVHERLRAAAHRIASTTRVPRVVFGHAHQLHDDGTYLNTGSFGMPPRGGPRSWVVVSDGVARHGTMMPGAGLSPGPRTPTEAPPATRDPVELPGLA